MSLLKGIVFTLAACILSLPGAAAGQAERSSDDIRVVQTTGFSIPELGDEIQLATTEISNGVLYTLDVRRESTSDPHRFSDTVPLLRLSQTIRPLAGLGTVDDLQQAVLADAYGLLDKTLNPAPEPPQELTREIMGQVRAGQAFPATFGLDADASIAGMVECYAFEHEGSGIAVILKHTDTVARAKADDEAHLDNILRNLVIKQVSPTTPYVYTIAGVPLSLPLGSRVENIQQHNDGSIHADIQLEGGTLTLFMAQIPQGSQVNASRELNDNYATQVREAVEQSKGEVEINWSSRTALPPGPGKSDPFIVPVYHIDAPAGSLYSAFCSSVTDSLAITGTFTLEGSKPELAHAYIRPFTQQLPGRNQVLRQAEEYLAFPGHSLTLPGMFNVGETLLRDDGEIEAVVLNIVGPVRAESVIDSADQHRSYTLISTIRDDEHADLPTLHARLCQRLGRAAEGEQGPGETSQVVADDDTLRPYQQSKFTPASPDDRASQIVVSSCLLPSDSSGVRLMATSVSNAMMVSDELAMTQWLISKITPNNQIGQHRLDFATIEYDDRRTPLTTKRAATDDHQHTQFRVGDEWIDVYTFDRDPRNEVLSRGLLAERHFTPIWARLAFADEAELYPADADVFVTASVADQKALMYHAHLPGRDIDTTRQRAKSCRVRLYGIQHGQQFSVIRMIQSDNFDDARFDEIIGMFRKSE